MSTNLTPIDVQAAAMGVPVPVGKTAEEITAIGFVVPNDVWREDVFRMDTEADKNTIDTSAFGRLTGYHWERHCSWFEQTDGLWRRWCGCVRCTVFISEGKPSEASIICAADLRGWVKKRASEDMIAALKEIFLFEKYVCTVMRM